MIFKQMTNEKQTQKQTPFQFIIMMFTLRDRVLELARHDKATKDLYKRKMVQYEMQRGIFAGLRDEEVRQELKILLRQSNVDDDDLLDELRFAEASRRDHESRFE